LVKADPAGQFMSNAGFRGMLLDAMMREFAPRARSSAAHPDS
jgi:hypothetical protein